MHEVSNVCAMHRSHQESPDGEHYTERLNLKIMSGALSMEKTNILTSCPKKLRQ